MPAQKANIAQFFFFCGDLDLSTFEVIDFEGKDSISSPYEFTINLISRNPDIQADEVVNKQATLYVYRDEEYYPYSGIISDFNYIETTTDFSRYSVVMVPRLWLLNMNHQTRIFQKMTVPDIVKQVLDEANLTNYYQLDLAGSYPQREYVVQYQESDLNFISRLMENVGIWYFFKELPLLEEDIGQVNVEQLVISDNPSSFGFINGHSDIIYRPQSGFFERIDDMERESIHRFSYRKRLVPSEVQMKNYNYRTPEVSLSGAMNVGGGDVGTVYHYGGDYKDADGAQQVAEIEAGRIVAGQIKLNGEANCRGFRAGCRFTVEEPDTDEPQASRDMSGIYLIREVIHSGSHSAMRTGDAEYTYANKFVALSSDQIDTFRPLRKAKIPRVNGIMTALIEANGSDYAALDDQGRYKVRMPFDLSDNANYEGSKYIRLAQPYAGNNYGMHFPSHEGAEMVWACVDGDPDKPLGLGTVPNANTVSPVVSGNKEQSVIRTAGANEMVMDDTDGKQKIRMTTAAKNVSELDDENKRAYVQTTNGNKILLDDANEQCSWNAKDHNITMSYKSGEEGVVITTGGGHVIRVDDKNKAITIQSNGGHVVEMDDNGGTITLADGKGKNTVTLDGSQGLILDSKGKISINATQDIDIKGANINMEASSGKLEAKAMQDVNISGMNISQKANMDAAIEAGMNLGMKANMNASMEGSMGAEVKSSLQAKMSGTMTEVSGSAMTTVKGGIVMVN
ncbi:MAG: type VI secretion system Vgr family protein [Chitinivibrionales bacterium]